MNVVENAVTLTKNGGCSGCPDGTAVSNQQITGSGALQFSTDDSSTLRFVGLAASGIGTTPSDITFAIRLQASTAEVRESGTYRFEISFGPGDTFSIAVNNGSVTYAKNGSVFYTSTVSASGSLRAHAIFFDVNGSLRNVAFGGSAAATAEASVPAASSVVTGTRQLRGATSRGFEAEATEAEQLLDGYAATSRCVAGAGTVTRSQVTRCLLVMKR
jgi:hypothetical protein